MEYIGPLLLISLIRFGLAAAYNQADKPIMILHEETKTYIRTSGSAGGLVSGLDTFAIQGTLTRKKTSIEKYPNNLFNVQIRSIDGDDWTVLSNCSVKLGECEPSQSRLCYCSKKTEYSIDETFEVSLKIIATAVYSQRAIRLSWTKFDYTHTLGGNTVMLPVVCDQSSGTYKVGGTSGLLTNKTKIKSTPEQAITSLEFCMKGLKGSYTLKIVFPRGEETNISECVTVPLIDDDTEKSFNLSYVEPSSDGCGRTGSYKVLIIECLLGFWGPNCTDPCPGDCGDKGCDLERGVCAVEDEGEAWDLLSWPYVPIWLVPIILAALVAIYITVHRFCLNAGETHLETGAPENVSGLTRPTETAVKDSGETSENSESTVMTQKSNATQVTESSV